MSEYDAIIVGSGPNGMTAAITVAEAGCRVLVVEAQPTIGGGTRTQQLTLPDFQHDVCSAIHPLGVASPIMRRLPLADYGLEWIYPQASAAHPLDDGDAIMVYPDVTHTAAGLGRDQAMYERLFGTLHNHHAALLGDFLAPLRVPDHPVPFALFGAIAMLPANALTGLLFREKRTRAMFAGMAAHSLQPLERPATAAFGLILLTLAHAVGWPLARGGSQQITEAMARYLQTLGGTIQTDFRVASLADLPPARKILFDTNPHQLATIAADRLPALYRRRLQNFRYGAGVFKVDYALTEPIPWTNPRIREAATVHLGGTQREISVSERLCNEGIHAGQPYVLVAQQSLFDEARAPAGKHTAWAYCHVPHGSDRDMTAAIEAQLERYAPGFRDCVLARHTMNAVAMERYNPNYVGGDINGGVQDLTQIFTRPVTRLSPYTTPDPDLFICSSSTPPGGGVHGMCGYYGAQAALKTL